MGNFVYGYFALAIESNPWKNLGRSNNMDANSAGWKVLLSFTQDWYTLCLTIGLIGFLITLMWVGLKLLYMKSGDKRREAKDAITAKVIVATSLFAITTVIGFVVTLAQAMVN